MALALVGGPCRGKINIAFDERVRTNQVDPLGIAITRKYPPRSAVMSAGKEVGSFRFGSSVVVVCDVPMATRLAIPSHGSADRTVLRGQPLLKLSGGGLVTQGA